MITRENYEEHFLDYFEGCLSEKEVEMLLRFLSQNPDLEDEFYLLMQQSSDVVLSADDFSSLTVKREANIGYELSTFDYLCVADLEHDITGEEQSLLIGSIEGNKKLKQDYLSYQNTKLAVEEVACPFKEELKKNVFAVKSSNGRKIASYSSVAAAVLLVFYFAYNEVGEHQVADNGSQPTTAIAPRSTNEVVKEMAKHPVVAENAIQREKRPSQIQENKSTLGVERVALAAADIKTADEHLQQQVVEQMAYLQVNHDNISVEPTQSVALGGFPLSGVEPGSTEESASIFKDNELSKSVSDFLDKAKGETTEIAGSLEEIRGRKKGVFIGKVISGINAVLGTDMQYASKYTVDGKLVAISFEAGKINYSKKYDEEK